MVGMEELQEASSDLLEGPFFLLMLIRVCAFVQVPLMILLMFSLPSMTTHFLK